MGVIGAFPSAFPEDSRKWAHLGCVDNTHACPITSWEKEMESTFSEKIKWHRRSQEECSSLGCADKRGRRVGENQRGRHDRYKKRTCLLGQCFPPESMGFWDFIDKTFPLHLRGAHTVLSYCEIATALDHSLSFWPWFYPTDKPHIVVKWAVF